MTKHLAILSKVAIDQIMGGKKTIETRFSQKRISPFGKVSVGDLVFMKQPGGDIKSSFLVKKVISFENLSEAEWEIIKTLWNQISLGSKESDEEFLKSKQDARFGTLIFIGDVVQYITSPIKIPKKDQRGWAVLEDR